MRRREFIKVVAGLAVALPFAVRAQQPERMRRIGVLLGANADDVEFQTWVGAFLEGLQQAGWSIGQNVQIDTHWATSDAAGIRKHAAELVALAPDVILAHGTSTVAPLLQQLGRCRLWRRCSAIRSALASLTAWRGLAATSPVS